MSSFASSGSGASQSMAEGKAQEMMYRRQAEATLIEADIATREQEREKEAVLGSERALYAKAGVDISEGSPLLMMEETAKRGEYAQEITRWQAVNKYRMLRWAGRIAKKGGEMGAVTEAVKTGITLLGMAAGGVAGGIAAGGSGAISGMQAGYNIGSGSNVSSGLNWLSNLYKK